MSQIYDNWERLVAATLKRELIRQLCLSHSRETSSISSQPSDFSTCPSPLPDPPFDSSFGDIEFQHIARVEKNEEIHVNGEPLSVGQLIILRSCKHPPKKLKSGYYWYDKATGFWGKQGQKPSQIISPHLNVGGRLNVNASSGNTRVYINGREITKVEQRMLKFAGVNCWPDTSLWLDKDGFYQFEGQNTILGCIWDKAMMKLLCSLLLSLPFPPKSDYASGEQSVPNNSEQNESQKLLLIGCNGSGTGTIFNQAADIFKPHYNKTVHYAEEPSLVSSMGFTSPLRHDGYMGNWDPKDGFIRYELSRVSIDGFGDDCNWLKGFGDTRIAIFCISLNDYDQLVMDHNGDSVNKMMVARKFFESFVTQFHLISVLLLLTKYDLFEEKIKLSPLYQCDWFNEFNPVKIDGNNYLGQMSFHFISVKFKRLYKALTGQTLYVAPVNCLAQDSVDAAIKYAREILKWDEQSVDYISGHSGDYISDESIYSDDE